MNNFLFMILALSINLIQISCFDSSKEKCNKFVDDYHNPAVDKLEEFLEKLASYNNSINVLKYATWGDINVNNLSFNTGEDVNTFNSITINGAAQFGGLNVRQGFDNSQVNFDTLMKLANESIDSFKKIIDINSEVCKNQHPSIRYLDKVNGVDINSRPGDSDYKSKIEKLKNKVDKVMNINKAFRERIKQILGI